MMEWWLAVADDAQVGGWIRCLLPSSAVGIQDGATGGVWRRAWPA